MPSKKKSNQSSAKKQANKLLCKVEADGDSLRLRFTQNGLRKAIGTGLKNTPDNWAIASQVASRVHLCLASGDELPPIYILLPWKSQKVSSPPSTRIDSKSMNTFIDIQNVFMQYSEYRRRGIKESTFRANYECIQLILSKLPSINPLNALEVRENLLKVTTPQQTRKILMMLNAACKWASKHGLIEKNTFEGMYLEMEKPNYSVNPEPNPFTADEQREIILAFSAWDKTNYYSDFVEFLFLTGCRPGEAIALKWEDIDWKRNVIKFHRSISQVAGKTFETEGTKTNEAREFPLAGRLAWMIGLRVQSRELVFPSIEGKAINYSNFSRRYWKKIVDPIKPETTPYNCRDTFITRQIFEHKVPPIVVAKWVGNSVETIEKHYLGSVANTDYKPGE